MAFIKKNTKHIKSIFIIIELTVVLLSTAVGYYYFNSIVATSIKETKKELSEQSIHKSEHIANYLIGKRFEGEALFNNSLLSSNLVSLINSNNKESKLFLSKYFNNLFLNFYFDNAIVLNLEKQILFEAKPGSVKNIQESILKSEIEDTSKVKICICDYDFKQYTVTTRFLVTTNTGKTIGYVLLFSHGKRLNTLFDKSAKLKSKAINMFLTKINSDKIFITDKKNLEKKEVTTIIDKITSSKMGITEAPFLRQELINNQKYLISIKKIRGTDLLFTIIENQEPGLKEFSLTKYFIVTYILVFSGFIGLLLFVIYKKNYGLSPKRVKEEIEKSKLKNMFEITENSFIELQILINSNGQILKYNNEVINKFQYSSEEFAKINFVDLFADSDKSEIKSKIEELLNLGKIVFETECNTKFAEIFPAEVNLSLFNILNNNYIHCFIKDLTEKKETINKIKAGERIYTTLLHNLPGIAYRCKNDPNWTMEFISEGCKNLTGYNVEDLLYNKVHSYSSLICDEYKEMVWNTTVNSLREKKQFSYEYEINTKNDGKKWVFEKGVGVFDENGELLFLEGFIADISAKKLSEAKLIENENLFKNAFENAATSKVIFSVNGDYINVNHAFCRMLGYEKSELINKNMRSFTYPPDILKSKNVILTVLNNPQMDYSYSKRFVNKKGDIVYVKSSISLQKDNMGRAQFFIEDILDLTTEQKFKSQLAESEVKYKLLAESALEGIFLIDKNLHLEFINSYAAKLIDPNKQIEEFLNNKEIHKIFNISDEQIVEIFNVKAVKLIETEIGNNGNTINLSTKLVPIVDENNDVKLVLGISRDETEKKLIYDNLDKTRRMLNIIIDTILQRVFWKNRDSVYMGCNQLMARDGGFESAEQLIGKTDYDCLWKDQAEDFIKQDKKVLQTGKEILNYTETVITASGGTIWVNTSKVPLRDSDGNIIGILGVYQDITKEKKREDELNITLEKLENSNKELEQFAYVASHDLQEPLRMVASYTALLEQKYKDKLDNAANEYIFYAIDGARRMQRLIDDLLDFSRIKTRGREFKKVNLSEIIGQVLVSLKHKINEKKAIIANGFLPIVYGDEMQIMRVFQNLIDNSLKYSGDKDPYIFIFTVEQENDYIITVKDNGIGIDPIYKDKIFEIFERLHTSNEYSGTGIGLAVVKRIIERHGGRIWLDINEQKGATFKFTLKKNTE